jgi:uncharacterized membrane protein (UPF0127 family)
MLVVFPAVSPASSSLPKAQVKIGEIEILVEIPDTPSLKYKGLGKRNYLGEFEGMLFVFREADFHLFHMKNMRFPIDIIWIRSGVVVDVSKNVPVPVDSRLPTYAPKVKADMVLEVNAYFTDRYNIRPGDKVAIQPLR